MRTNADIISAIANNEVIPNIGQIDAETRRQLDKMVRAGGIAKWRGKWFPHAGAAMGLGPDKTCYGSHEAAAFFIEMRGGLLRVSAQ